MAYVKDGDCYSPDGRCICDAPCFVGRCRHMVDLAADAALKAAQARVREAEKMHAEALEEWSRLEGVLRRHNIDPNEEEPAEAATSAG